MKLLKLGLLAAVAVAALMAFGGTASASTVTSPTGTTYTSTIKATSGAVSFTGSFVKVECSKASFEGKVEQHGGTQAGGSLSSGSFEGCNFEVTVLKWGKITFHQIAGSENATVTSAGGEFVIHTSVGSCVFTTSATDIGYQTAGPPSVLHFFAKLPRTGGNFLCGSSGTLTGTFTFNTPGSMYFD